MDSRSADCVLGEARLISSPTTTLAKIAPGRTSKSRTSWLNTLTPVMSLGSRSGVNCTRRTEQSIERARVLASMVLPTPGTSSSRRCPSASSTVMAVHDVAAALSVGNGARRGLADAVVGKHDRPPDELGQPRDERLETVLRVDRTFRAAEVTGENDRRPTLD